MVRQENFVVVNCDDDYKAHFVFSSCSESNRGGGQQQTKGLPLLYTTHTRRRDFYLLMSRKRTSGERVRAPFCFRFFSPSTFFSQLRRMGKKVKKKKRNGREFYFISFFCRKEKTIMRCGCAAIVGVWIAYCGNYRVEKNVSGVSHETAIRTANNSSSFCLLRKASNDHVEKEDAAMLASVIMSRFSSIINRSI